MATQDPGVAGGQTGDQGWLPALLDIILGGTEGPLTEEGKLKPGASQYRPLEIYDLFTGGPGAPTFFPGASLDRVIYEPGPIYPAKEDQAIGMLAALLANRYNQRRGAGGAGGGAAGDLIQALGGLVGGLFRGQPEEQQLPATTTGENPYAGIIG